MTKKKVYLICGVSGSGKTWVCEQLKDKFTYVPHDKHYNDIGPVVSRKASLDKPVITESPFGERLVRDDFEQRGLEVIPIFVITPAEKVASQYLKREGKPLPKAAFTRASTIINRAKEWKSFHGTAEQVLKHLKEI